MDTELAILCEFLEMIDQKLNSINELISNSIDPDSDGLCDRGEYFIGIGFVAIQQYLVESLIATGVSKGDAYRLGPIHSSEQSIISIINDCANYWKHEAEWVGVAGLHKQGLKTYSQVTDVADTDWYKLSNVLFSLCDGNKFSFNSLIPYIRDWQVCIHENR
ncbi:hypothetical protein [Aliikangiella maris]|uniref:Uncharacterized protein n=2 Tax=Aliikangiella maris TaxID=3162458 RepID=A0ABV3MUZ7_9GAMM